MDDIDFLRIRFLEVNETVAMITVARRKSRPRDRCKLLADGYITRFKFVYPDSSSYTASPGTGQHYPFLSCLGFDPAFTRRRVRSARLTPPV
jgi:hypothetical protein